MTPERLAKLTAEAAQTGQAVISKEEVAEIVELFSLRGEWADDLAERRAKFTAFYRRAIQNAWPTPTGDA